MYKRGQPRGSNHEADHRSVRTSGLSQLPDNSGRCWYKPHIGDETSRTRRTVPLVPATPQEGQARHVVVDRRTVSGSVP